MYICICLRMYHMNQLWAMLTVLGIKNSFPMLSLHCR